MKTIKKFTAMQLSTVTVNRDVNIQFSFGRISGPYYDEEHPKEEFDTEEEALKYAYEFDRWATWVIVPIVRFNKN